MIRKKHNILAVIIMLVTALTLSSFTLFNSSVEIDTAANRVYNYITAEKLLNDFSKDSKSAQAKYNNKFVLLSGLFESSDNKGLSVMDENFKAVSCTFDKNITSNLKFSFKDNIAVYGKISCTFGKPELTEVRKVIDAPVVRSSDIYYTLDGTVFDKSASVERTLNNGRIKYYIPSGWKKIEADIAQNDLGIIEGYQYVLNKTPGNTSEVPESLFVCYFDKELLKTTSDIKSTEQVEKAIISNINPDEKIGTFPSANITTYYGARYQYYSGKYQRGAGQAYRTEYVFQPDGDNGILMFLYLYPNDNKYLSEVILTTRFAEIN